MIPIVLIKSCHKHAARRQAQLDTWLPELDWAEHLFLLGRPTQAVVPDSLMRDVSDDFPDLAPKVQCAVAYALGKNYSAAVILDDDTYIRPDRLFWALKSYELHNLDYVGFLRVTDKPYCQGSCFYLSARAMEYVANSPEMRATRLQTRPGELGDYVTDDGAVGKALCHKVYPTHDDRFQPGPVPVFPHPSNEIISAHKCYTPELMQQAHAVWKAE